MYLEAQGSTITRKYGYGNALYRKDGEYPLFDGLGSERTVTNGSQTVTGTINFDVFGQAVGTTGSSSNPYMFAATSGYRNDGDAGLTHVRARFYDGQVGRFVSRDTVLSEHPYLYCNADPVNHVDPDGQKPFDFVEVWHWMWDGFWTGFGGMLGLKGGPVGVGLGSAIGAGVGETSWQVPGAYKEWLEKAKPEYTVWYPG